MGEFDGGGKSTIILELGERGGAHVQLTMTMGGRQHNDSNAASGWRQRQHGGSAGAVASLAVAVAACQERGVGGGGRAEAA